MATVADISVVKELARRTASNGETFELLWDEAINTIYLSYFHEYCTAQIVVPNDKALDAFYHPHAYLEV